MTLLDVNDLRITLDGRRLVDGVSFSLAPGERLGIIGESGSGKSMTCFGILGLLPAGAQAHGSVRLDGEELIGRSERQLRGIRGRRISCVFQEPLSALDPLLPIHRQLTAPLRAHRMLGRGQARETALRLAESVGLPEPERLIRRYPHELSGGQRQRVMIAMAMSTEPSLLLADEPTTALDVTVQARILSLVQDLVRERGTSTVMVTHDMAVALASCDRILVMQNGRIVDQGAPAELVHRPGHEYTAGLVRAAYATSWQPSSGASPAAPTHEPATPPRLAVPA